MICSEKLSQLITYSTESYQENLCRFVTKYERASPEKLSIIISTLNLQFSNISGNTHNFNMKFQVIFSNSIHFQLLLWKVIK